MHHYFKDYFAKAFHILSKYRKFVIAVLILWTLWFFGLGFLGGWLLFKGSLSNFPEINKNDRVLLLAPHIDDETISSGGLIQEAVAREALVKIVYATNGDENVGSLILHDTSFSPNDFVNLGIERISEGKTSATILGLSDLVFLGYPDEGLSSMLSKNFNCDSPFTSKATHFNFNPYEGTLEKEQKYCGANLLNDLSAIIKEFKPTIILVSHNRDKNSDHRALYSFLEKALLDYNNRPKVFTYLVHFTYFPPVKKYRPNEFIYPPKRLFTQSGWVSFNLSSQQEELKLKAVNQYKTQLRYSMLDDLLRSFVKRNEIFEEIE